MKVGNKKYVDATKLSLDEWLALLNSAEKEDLLFICWEFPTDAMREEYLETIQDRTDEEVINLLRNFLIPSGSLGSDKWAFEYLMHCLKHDKDQFEKLMETEHYKRLFKGYLTGDSIWEGNTWIIDLLPHYPKLALDVLHAYLLTHFGFLPDGRIDGLQDAMAVIRAKFIETPQSSLLLSLHPYQFEHLIDALYTKMGYTTTLTPPTHDKGRDVIAEKEDVGEREILLIQCTTTKNLVGVEEVRAFLGVVLHPKTIATKGVFVSTSDFTSEAKKFADEDPRLELIGNKDLQVSLNKYFGPKWPKHIDFIISRSLSKRSKKNADA